jgi:hypothetical protein
VLTVGPLRGCAGGVQDCEEGEASCWRREGPLLAALEGFRAGCLAIMDSEPEVTGEVRWGPRRYMMMMMMMVMMMITTDDNDS